MSLKIKDIFFSSWNTSVSITLILIKQNQKQMNTIFLYIYEKQTN